MNRLALLALAAAVVVGCGPKGSETDLPDVNKPRPNPVVERTNQLNVPLTNLPVEKSATNR